MPPALHSQRRRFSAAAADRLTIDVECVRDAFGAITAVLGALRPPPRVVDERVVAVLQASTARPAIGTHGPFIAPADDKALLPRGRRACSSPAQLVQPLVINAEVVCDLVNYGNRDLIDDFFLGVTRLQ